jgi:hypothetical protein
MQLDLCPQLDIPPLVLHTSPSGKSSPVYRLLTFVLFFFVLMLLLQTTLIAL